MNLSDSTPPNPGVRARLRAALVLSRHRETRKNVDGLINADTGYGAVMPLVYGVVKRRRTIDWMLRKGVAHVPENTVGELLRIGIFQLAFEASAPDYAVVASVTEAARLHGEAGKIVGFVNGALRGFIRRRDKIFQELSRAPLAVRESHPDILVRRWSLAFGPEDTQALCRWNNLAALVTLYPLPVSGGTAPFLQRCLQAGIALSPHPSPRSGGALVMPRGMAVADLPGYREGHFLVQDPSTLKAVELLAPAPGSRVLDGCAAPGGKAVRSAWQLGSSGMLLAVEKIPSRARLLKDNLKRHGLAKLTSVLCADFLDLRPENTGGGFDRILLDAPCSNTGVLQRRPDARWRFCETLLAERTRLQSRLLAHAPNLLNERGRIVYATCSIETEENREIVRKFLKKRPDFRLRAEAFTFPVRDGIDGMYAAALERKQP